MRGQRKDGFQGNSPHCPEGLITEEFFLLLIIPLSQSYFSSSFPMRDF